MTHCPILKKMLAYSWEVETSRRLHNSFTITCKILEVIILELLLNTDSFLILGLKYESISKEFYTTSLMG